MNRIVVPFPRLTVASLAFALGVVCLRADTTVASSSDPVQAAASNFSLHLQSTGIAQADPAFYSGYAGTNSLDSRGETQETLSFDVYAGARLWRGAEAFVDGLAWQGFGLSNAVGVDGFPNGEAFRLGTHRPDAILARIFIRQTFNFGPEDETIDDDALDLGGRRSVSRLTLTLGKFSAKDIFDNNAYANDSRTQFMNWGFMANEAWDYPADSLGYETGFAAELNQPDWAVRCGVFQMPRASNAMPVDPHLLKAWGMVVEVERRYRLGGRHGAARLLLYRNRADMGSYQDAVDSITRPADVVSTRAYRYKDGVCLNLEQEITDDLGVFSRLGWSDGRNEAWCFSDVDRTVSFGASLKGARWHRGDDTVGIAGAVNAISSAHRAFLAAGGVGILAGDGALDYGTERILEAYYDARLTKGLNAAVDYQFIANPAFNRARGPVSVFGLRIHWEY